MPGELAAYAGIYASGTAVKLEVVEQGGRLSLDVALNGRPLANGSGPLMMVAPDRAVFDFAEGLILTDFARDDRGEVNWVRFSGRLLPRIV